MEPTPSDPIVSAQAATSWRQRPLLRLIPLLAITALGLFLWRASNPPEKRILTVALSGLPRASAVEVQVLGPDGALVQREERYFTSGVPPAELTLTSPLRRGAHRVRVFASVPGEEKARGPAAAVVDVGEDEAYSVRLRF